MAYAIDDTHDARLRSWVASANGHADFPIQNLPHGAFRPETGEARGGIAIGDKILDVGRAHAAGLFSGTAAEAAGRAAQPTLNDFFALPSAARQALRTQVSALLSDAAQPRPELLHDSNACTLHVPAAIGDYTDFYAGIQHAENVGKLFRPDNPLLPNYKWVPIGYHGRGSSIRPSGTDVRRPNGQRKRPDETVPSFGPCRNLDYELEIGVWIGAGNELGMPIAIADAGEHISGFCLFNDWSARDVQAWEYQPLGPFLSKSFGSTISPWVVTPEALAPFRIAQLARPAGDPAPLPYLFDEADQGSGAFDIAIEVLLLTKAMREAGTEPFRLGLSNTKHMYWTAAQLVAHHTSNGCDLNPGDMFGSGTISAPDPSGFGSLLEVTEGGKKPIALPNGESRTFLQDGDEIMLRGRAARDGFVSIGFGECRGSILPAA